MRTGRKLFERYADPEEKQAGQCNGTTVRRNAVERMR
jgi:hypothetical protein